MATASKARLLTIGNVCGMLKDDFPDISISKIRYLEDQGLLAPRRTEGGYRLFSEDDVERLETILRLQRDEFLPLRVIRQELASPAARDRKRRRAAGLAADEPELDLDGLC
jgi:DNA-binding transcriptional MerR regulator